VVKEGGPKTLLQVSFIVLVGTTVSNLVCFSIWPESATSHLQQNMTKTLDSFSTLLRMLTRTFLLEEPLYQPSHEKLQRAIESHQSSFTTLKKNLTEAYSEWFHRNLLGGSRRSAGKTAYEDAVNSLNRLAQHLNGLRSGTRLQYELAKALGNGKVVLGNRDPVPAAMHGEAFLEEQGKGKAPEPGGGESNTVLQAAAAMFGDLVDDLGPPLQALSVRIPALPLVCDNDPRPHSPQKTCTTTLKRLRDAFEKRRHRDTEAVSPQEFQELADGIQRALFTFESTSNHAVMRLYRKSDVSPAGSTDASSFNENPVLSSSEGEHIFLVYLCVISFLT
jgi:hypothetical protein